MKDRILKCLELNRQADEIRKELRNEAIISIEENRILQPGDKVEIWNVHDNVFHAYGIVGRCINSLMIRTRDISELASFKDMSDEEIEKEKESLRYEIFAMKTDGTASSKHMFQYPHYMSLIEEVHRVDDYAIKLTNGDS